VPLHRRRASQEDGIGVKRQVVGSQQPTSKN
jgi:hypothetical protein